jgi:hypothetical protein
MGDRPLLTLTIANPAGAELATLETSIPEQLPPLDPQARMQPDHSTGPRVPISWDAVVVGKSMRALLWEPTVGSQKLWCTGVSDDLPVYQSASAPVHPGTILQAANHAFRNHFELKPWIHVGSKIRTRGFCA